MPAKDPDVIRISPCICPGVSREYGQGTAFTPMARAETSERDGGRDPPPYAKMWTRPGGVRGLPVPLCDSGGLVALWGFEPAWAAACEDYICTLRRCRGRDHTDQHHARSRCFAFGPRSFCELWSLALDEIIHSTRSEDTYSTSYNPLL